MYKFEGKCRYHGLTEFNRFGCIKCKNATRAIYRVYKKRINKDIIYYTTGNKDITNMKINYLFPYLIKRNRKNAKQLITRITKGPGTYGIFLIDKRAQSGENEAQKYLGKCLYVGQSTNVQNRVNQHIKNIKLARKDKNKELCIFPYPKVPSMYYDIAEYEYERIKIVKLTSIKHRQTMSNEELFESLTFLEQWGMDCFKPEYNVTAARRSDIKY